MVLNRTTSSSSLFHENLLLFSEASTFRYHLHPQLTIHFDCIRLPYGGRWRRKKIRKRKHYHELCTRHNVYKVNRKRSFFFFFMPSSFKKVKERSEQKKKWRWALVTKWMNRQANEQNARWQMILGVLFHIREQGRCWYNYYFMNSIRIQCNYYPFDIYLCGGYHVSPKISYDRWLFFFENGSLCTVDYLNYTVLHSCIDIWRLLHNIVSDGVWRPQT